MDEFPIACLRAGCRVPHWHPETGDPPDDHFERYDGQGNRKVVPKWNDRTKRARNWRVNWFSLAVVADQLGVSRQTLYRWIRTEGFPARQQTRRGNWRVRGDELDAWIRASGKVSTIPKEAA